MEHTDHDQEKYKHTKYFTHLFLSNHQIVHKHQTTHISQQITDHLQQGGLVL